VLGETREIRVALPAAYHEGTGRYDVLYVLDGEWHFLQAEAAMRMLAEVSYISPHRIPPLIVVGVVNTDRNRDFTPTACTDQHGMSFPTSGGADAFLSFLTDELIPVIDGRFRTNDHRILAGWSLGGLLTVHALLARPDAFDAHLAISPSLWWDDRRIVRRATDPGLKRDRDLVVTIGTAEEGGLCSQAVRSLQAEWNEQPIEDLRWSVLDIEGEDHNHGPHAAYFNGLRALYADWFFPEAVIAGGIEAARSHYAEVSRRFRREVHVPGYVYDYLTRTQLADGRTAEAVATARARCRSEPASSEAQYQLAEIHRQTEDFAAARDAYRRALALERSTDRADTVFVRWVEDRLAGLPASGPRCAYAGQAPPGTVPQVFAGFPKPESGYHSSVVFNASMDAAYWTSMDERSWVSRCVDGVWTSPVPLPLDEGYGVGEPMPTATGRLYFLSRRPTDADSAVRERIWWVRPEEAGWSEPRPVDGPLAAHPTHWQFSFTDAHDLYFTSEIDGGQDIHVARWRGDGFGDSEPLAGAVNTNLREFCPFVAPDESYLLFARTVPGESGRSDLFVSFRNDGGLWTEAVPLGEPVNSPHNEVCPVVTPDGRYLFFLRASGDVNDVFWVRAEVIEAARARPAG
jgi:predicted alpha/beta superfamily hydrolase